MYEISTFLYIRIWLSQYIRLSRSRTTEIRHWLDSVTTSHFINANRPNPSKWCDIKVATFSQCLPRSLKIYKKWQRRRWRAANGAMTQIRKSPACTDRVPASINPGRSPYERSRDPTIEHDHEGGRTTTGNAKSGLSTPSAPGSTSPVRRTRAKVYGTGDVITTPNKPLPELKKSCTDSHGQGRWLSHATNQSNHHTKLSSTSPVASDPSPECPRRRENVPTLPAYTVQRDGLNVHFRVKRTGPAGSNAERTQSKLEV